MKHTVYILGAGCSRNYSLEHRSSLAGLESPLDYDFFKMASIVLANEPPLSSKLLPLKNRMKQLFGFDMDNLASSPAIPGLENVATILDLDAKQSGNSEVVDLLFDLVSVVIWKALEGPPSDLHQRLAKGIEKGDTVISYNYDMLFDNALGSKLKDGTYRINFDWIFDGTWSRSSGSPSITELLKLHGSLNWLRCANCGSSLLYNFKALPRLVYEKLGLAPSSGDFVCPKCQRKMLKSAIIPPLLTKPLDDIEFKYVWDLASRRLTTADKIVVIGYSLPPTDYYSEMLLRKSISSRMQTELQLDVVNPNPEVVERLVRTLRPTEHESFDNLKEYVSS